MQRGQSEGRAREECKSTKRGQRYKHYKGRDTPKDTQPGR